MAYVPVHLRPGFKGTGASMPKDFQTPRDAAVSELKAIGFVESSGGQLYYPEEHPHVHIGIGADTFMAYSEGKQHEGGHGVSMYGNTRLAWGFKVGVAKLKAAHPDLENVEARLSQAASILKTYDKV